MNRVTAALALLAALAVGGATQAQQGTAPMLARSGSVAVKVTDYGVAQQQVRAVAAQQGAVLLDGKTSVNEKGRKHGWMRFRVTESRLSFLLPALESVGRLYSESVQTTDDLSDYEALARRVQRLQQHEQRLDGILQSPRRMRGSDILFLQERLFRASVDESLLTQQRVDFERQARESTLVVVLFEPGSLPSAPLGTWDLAGRYASAAAQARHLWETQAGRAATATAYLAVFSPLWIPALLAAGLLLAWLWRRRRWVASQAVTILGQLVTAWATADGWLRTRWAARRQSA